MILNDFVPFSLPTFVSICFTIFFVVLITWGVIDASEQRKQIEQMGCMELQKYVIDHINTPTGFPNIAKEFHTWKCEK